MIPSRPQRHHTGSLRAPTFRTRGTATAVLLNAFDFDATVINRPVESPTAWAETNGPVRQRQGRFRGLTGGAVAADGRMLGRWER